MRSSEALLERFSYGRLKRDSKRGLVTSGSQPLKTWRKTKPRAPRSSAFEALRQRALSMGCRGHFSGSRLPRALFRTARFHRDIRPSCPIPASVARDLTEVMKLHSEYVQGQMRSIAEQASEMGQIVSRAAMEAAKPKH